MIQGLAYPAQNSPPHKTAFQENAGATMTEEIGTPHKVGLKKKMTTNKHAPLKSKVNTYKIQRNKCVQLRKEAIKSYFKQSTKSGDAGTNLFWKSIRPFLSNKGTHDNHYIILEENGDLIKDKENISDILV